MGRLAGKVAFLTGGGAGIAKAAAKAFAREGAKVKLPVSSGTVDDMTGVAVFLASDESRMFTGTTLAADGGVSSYLNLATS